jgi:hypothetical protein
MSFQIDNRTKITRITKITNINDFKVGDLFLVDNKPEVALASHNNRIEPLLVVVSCVDVEKESAFQKAEFIDVHLIYGEVWHDVWETNSENLKKTWNFYPITKESHPEYFL